MRRIEDLPELRPYQDEPPQLPSGSFGKSPRLELRFEKRGDRSVLAEMFRRAPLIVQQALYWDEEMPGLPCVFIITNSGGILQGDRYEIEIEAGPQSMAHVTTQAATKIHEMDANFASQRQELVLHDGAYVEYLPDPIIPHKHSRFVTQTRVRIARSATLIYSEILMGGRKHYRDGELYQYDLFSSTVRGERPDCRELFTERFVVEPHRRSVRQLGVMGEYDVFGNVVLLTPPEHAEAIFAATPTTFSREEKWCCGASRLPNEAGLIFKVLADETEVARAKIRDFWSLVRPQVTGSRVPPEFSWR